MRKDVDNLVPNAVRYTEPSDAVKTVLQCDGDDAVLAVFNTRPA